jgi:nitrite reductase/ring-hydroxylating ferredoxin subunit
MTNARENELLTRIGPGTPMGAVMREYWLPAALSSEVKADGDPLRLMVLGEPLIAFRDTSARVGVIEHRCPHRGASLFFGRNEENGIRCIYHGWKFDVAGNCLDTPNLPPQQDVKHKVKTKAYRVTERYGLIWLYMGERAVPPPFPDFELNDLADADISLRPIQQEYNWLQGLENDLDTSHFGFLHLGGADPMRMVPGDLLYYLAKDRTPQYQIEDTPLGFMYGAYRPADAGDTHWRLAQFLAPFWVIPPAGMLADQIMVKGYIPMDDTHTFTITIARAGVMQMPARLKSGAPIPGIAPNTVGGPECIPNTTDWFGRWRLANNAGNDYLIDREAQRHGGVFSGINGLFVQDASVGGMLGPIADRTREFLTPSDAMIVRLRRKLLGLVQAHIADKTAKMAGVEDPGSYRGHRAGNFTAPTSLPFRQAYEEQMRRHANAVPCWAAE